MSNDCYHTKHDTCTPRPTPTVTADYSPVEEGGGGEGRPVAGVSRSKQRECDVHAPAAILRRVAAEVRSVCVC